MDISTRGAVIAGSTFRSGIFRGWNLVSGREHDRLSIRQRFHLSKTRQWDREGRTAVEYRYQQSPPGFVARDGKFVVYMSTTGGAGGYGLWLLPWKETISPFPTCKLLLTKETPNFRRTESGWPMTPTNPANHKCMCRRYPANGAKWQVSPAGGTQPRWRRDGKELFYISADQKLMAVPVKSGAAFGRVLSSQALFEIDPVFPPIGGRFAYQPAADGQRFLVLSAATGASTLTAHQRSDQLESRAKK